MRLAKVRHKLPYLTLPYFIAGARPEHSAQTPHSTPISQPIRPSLHSPSGRTSLHTVREKTYLPPMPQTGFRSQNASEEKERQGVPRRRHRSSQSSVDVPLQIENGLQKNKE